MNLGPQINTEGDESFPFITSEGNLFFSSDGHPGLGGLDIFKSIKTNGKWMHPINLAHPINSEKDDISFVTESDEKSGYFSSNRLEQQVGDDIYAFEFTPVVKINAFVRDKYTLLPIEGVLAKIYDEGGFVVFEGMSDENGYVEVSIVKGNCDFKMTIGENMDLADYNFDLDLCDKEKLPEDLLDLGIIEFGSREYDLTLTAEDMERNELIADVYTKIYDMETKELLFESLVAEDGKIGYALESERNYRVDVSHDDYETTSQAVSTMDLQGNEINLKVPMNLKDGKGEIVDVNVNPVDENGNPEDQNTVASIQLDNIYYDFDKSTIRKDSKIVLNKLVALMKSNPEIKIDMNSHTDSRGSNAYNMALSDRREDAAKNYLISAGIDASRLSSSHHGEEKLANNCSNNVKCSEDDHQLNRRTSFMILNPEALAANKVIDGNISESNEDQDDLAHSSDSNHDLDFMFAA